MSKDWLFGFKQRLLGAGPAPAFPAKDIERIRALLAKAASSELSPTEETELRGQMETLELEPQDIFAHIEAVKNVVAIDKTVGPDPAKRERELATALTKAKADLETAEAKLKAAKAAHQSAAGTLHSHAQLCGSRSRTHLAYPLVYGEPATLTTDMIKEARRNYGNY